MNLKFGGEFGAALGESPSVQALQIFIENYRTMRRLNWKYSDGYFHCKANCEATQCGGQDAAEVLSDFREMLDMATGDNRQVSLLDQFRNRTGRYGAITRPDATCQQICSVFRPNGLPTEY